MENRVESVPTPALPAAAPLTDDEVMHRAYERVLPTLAAAFLEPLEPLNLNVAKVVTKVLGAIPGILVHREALGQLATFDVGQVDLLKERVLALGHAYGLRRAAPEAVDDVPELARSLRALREQLHADARALAKRGLLDAEQLGRLHGGKAHHVVPFDVLALVEVFLQHWESIAGKTAVTLSELDGARREANRLIEGVGRRKRAAPEVDGDELTYRRLYTWVVRSYADVRCALQFVRRSHGDAELIAPSVFPGQRKRTNQSTVPRGAVDRASHSPAVSRFT